MAEELVERAVHGWVQVNVERGSSLHGIGYLHGRLCFQLGAHTE